MINILWKPDGDTTASGHLALWLIHGVGRGLDIVGTQMCWLKGDSRSNFARESSGWFTMVFKIGKLR